MLKHTLKNKNQYKRHHCLSRRQTVGRHN